MSPRKFVLGLIKKNCQDSGSLCLNQPQSVLVFTARSYGDLSSWHWNPKLGGPVWGWNPLLLRGTSAAKTALLIFHRPPQVWDQHVACL